MPRRIRCKHCKELFNGFFGEHKTCESCIGKSEETLNTVPLFPTSAENRSRQSDRSYHATFTVAVETCRFCQKPFSKGDRIAFTANDPDSYRHYECLDSLKESVEASIELAPPVTAPTKLVDRLRAILQDKEDKKVEADKERIMEALISRVSERSDLYFDMHITLKSSVDWLRSEGITVERIDDPSVTVTLPPKFRLSGWDTSSVKTW